MKDIEKEILKTLYENRNERALSVRKIYKELNSDYDQKEVEQCVKNLKEKGFLRSIKDPTIKSGPYNPGPTYSYEINSKGTEFVENDFIVIQKTTTSPTTLIVGENINFGQITNIQIDTMKIIKELSITDELRSELKDILREIETEMDKETVNKGVVNALIKKIANNGIEKLTDAAISFVFSKFLGL